MSCIQSKIIRHAKKKKKKKKQENTIHNEEKTKHETNPEMTQITELVDKDIKRVIITISYTFQKLEERWTYW